MTRDDSSNSRSALDANIHTPRTATAWRAGPRCYRRLVWSIAVVLPIALSMRAAPVHAAPPEGIFTGSFADGATWVIEIPSDWNGTLILFSHGYVAPGFPNPAVAAADPVTQDWLVAHGFAVAGSSYSGAGWVVEDALVDQIDTLDEFIAIRGQPTRTIAMGQSMGGLITAALIELHPERFSGAVPMCGFLGGAVSEANLLLDQAFVLKTLVIPQAPVQLVDIANPYANYFAAISALTQAEADPTGQSQARIALAAAVGSVPGWFDPLAPEPARSDYTARLQNQIQWVNYLSFFGFALRADVEAHAGGNPSWNTAVDYSTQLARSSSDVAVRALYAQAGLDLQKDLATLHAAPRITANASAVDYMTEFNTPTGNIHVPILTMHTTGDGLVPVSHERAYATAVEQHDADSLLQQLFVDRAGHCTFTSAEVVSAVLALNRRLDTGRWSRLRPDDLNTAAKSLGPEMGFIFGRSSSPAAPSYISFVPPLPLRPQSQGD